jgi:ubiquinone/menaquinone biosynthesis C-methylase UbiE
MDMDMWWDSRYKTEQFIWDKIPSKCAETSLNHLKEMGVKKILDLPCGYGRDSIFLSKSGFDVVGVDRSHEAINLAKQWASDEGVDVEFQQADATNLTFPDESFDAIISNRFLHLCYDDETQLTVTNEIYRLVKSGGLVILATRSIEDPDCTDYNNLYKRVYEIKDRPGHKIRFNTIDELKSLFGNFNHLTIEKIEELEALDRNINCQLIKIIAMK